MSTNFQTTSSSRERMVSSHHWSAAVVPVARDPRALSMLLATAFILLFAPENFDGSSDASNGFGFLVCFFTDFPSWPIKSQEWRG